VNVVQQYVVGRLSDMSTYFSDVVPMLCKYLCTYIVNTWINEK
jgi:hypothetical protein